MNDRSQLLKGTLEGCILKIIHDQETYGYEISEKLKAIGFQDISEGTIYPLLMRLEKNGWVEVSYKESPLGPRRKYFSLSPKGMEELRSFHQNWLELQGAIETLFIDFKGVQDYEKIHKRNQGEK